MYNVGDRVVIKNDLNNDMYDFTKEMKKYEGKISIITKVFHSFGSDDITAYYIDIDKYYFSWYDEYFLPYNLNKRM